MKTRLKTDVIMIHCAYTRPSMDIAAEWIKDIHVNENKWSDIGYHYFIQRDGTVEDGRDITLQGAHCPAVNATSIAICMAGGMSENAIRSENNFTEQQWESLVRVVEQIRHIYNIPLENILGHYERDVNKDCPAFNMDSFRILLNSCITGTKSKFMGSKNNEYP